MLMFEVCLHLCTCITLCSCALQKILFQPHPTCDENIELDGEAETKSGSAIACAVLCAERAGCSGVLYYSGTKACHTVNAHSPVLAACAFPGAKFYKNALEFCAPGQDPNDPTSLYSLHQPLINTYAAPAGNIIKVSIYDGEIECGGGTSADCYLFEDGCQFDRIIIYDGGIPQPRICGTFSFYEYFSQSSHVQIDWSSDGSYTFRGFRIVVEY